MLLVSITFNLSPEQASAFEHFLKQTAVVKIQELLEMRETRILKLLTEIDNSGVTYSLQLFFDKLNQYELFERSVKSSFLAELESNFRGNLVYFETLLTEI